MFLCFMSVKTLEDIFCCAIIKAPEFIKLLFNDRDEKEVPSP